MVAEVARLRRQRYTGQQIAAGLRISPATVSRILRRLGLNRLAALEPAEPVRRYEREHPGELIHIDIKKLGRFDRVGHRITGNLRGQSNSRGVGWEYVHVCIDDASRIAYAEIKKSERKASAIAFLKAVVIYYANFGISIQRVMTDNGSCYKSRAFGRACKRLGLKHIRTRPYTPKTNGKAERFIQTALREWAYAKAYQRSDHRGAELPLWLHRYNWHRPHGSIGAKPPISRTRSNREQPVEAPHLGRIDEWVAERMGQHRNPGAPQILRGVDGRWVMFGERRTGDGGTVAVYSDITELKQREKELSEKSEAMALFRPRSQNTLSRKCIIRFSPASRT